MNNAQKSVIKNIMEDWINHDIRVVDILKALAEYCEEEARYQTYEHIQPNADIAEVWYDYANEIKLLADKLDIP